MSGDTLARWRPLRGSVLVSAFLLFGALDCMPRAPGASDDVGVVEAALTTITISGTVTGPSGPLSGVTVSITGGATLSALTDASGTFSFAVATAKTYTVTATLAGCTFSAPQTFKTVGMNHTANFTGTGGGCTNGGTGGAGGSGAGGSGAGGSGAGGSGGSGAGGSGGSGAGGSGGSGAGGGVGSAYTTLKQYTETGGSGNLPIDGGSYAQLSLPAGTFLISSNTYVVNADLTIPATAYCHPDGTSVAGGDIPINMGHTIASTDVIQLAVPTVVNLSCAVADRFGLNVNMWVVSAAMTAIQIAGPINVQ